jgi:hypothetical protein
MSSPTDVMTTQVSANTKTGYSGYVAAGLACYTATGTLIWGRDLPSLLGSTSSRTVDPGLFSPFVLNATGDVMVAYSWSDPPPGGPARQTSQMYLGRINSNNANLIWYANYSTTATRVSTIVPRSARNDYVTFAGQFEAYGDVWQVVENTTTSTATASMLGVDSWKGALPDVDGSTVWLYGFGISGTSALNPWSTQTWDITSNPNRTADAFIIGVKDNGQSIGPWMSEGDWGPQYQVGRGVSGDLTVAAESRGYTTFNGGQDFITDAAGGSALIRVDHTNGQIKWRTPIVGLPTSIIAAPGNRIVVMSQQVDASTQSTNATLPYVLDIYSEADGTLLSSISAGTMAQYVAAGQTDLFVLGTVSAAADFDPGSGTDSQGSTAGVYISRFSF